MKIFDLGLFSWSSSSGVRTYITRKIEYIRRRSHLHHVVFVPGAADSVTTQGRSKVVVLPECGHLPHVEKAEAFVSELEAFIGERRAAA